MTIRILSCHPALPYVLNRTAPVGTTVRAKSNRRSNTNGACQIDIESKILEREIEAKALGEWLPKYLPYYGAQRVEIDGRTVTVPCSEPQLRQALLTRKR